MRKCSRCVSADKGLRWFMGATASNSSQPRDAAQPVDNVSGMGSSVRLNQHSYPSNKGAIVIANMQ